MNHATPGREALPHLGRVVFLSAVAALGGFLFGFDSGVINGAVAALQKTFRSDAIGSGFNVASMLLGCALGAFCAGALADKYGRKSILIATSVVFIVSAWGSGIAASSAEFVFYRVIGGLAVGAASILSPAYIGEIAPASIRGRLISLQQLAIVLGLVSSFLSNYILASIAGGAAHTLWLGFQTWRWMFWVELLPALLFFLSLLRIPESPRYLVAAGKPEKALATLAGMTDPCAAQQQVAHIQATVLRKRKPRLSDMLIPRTGRLHPIVWVGVALAALQQFTGINVVFYYGAVLWQAVGFTEDDALLTNVISGIVNVAFTVLAIHLVDRVGRRPLLMIGAVGQAFSLGLLAILFVVAAQHTVEGVTMTRTGGALALCAANVYIAFFAFTWGPVMWVMLGEMFPNKFRGAALAVAGLAQWLANFLVTITFPIMLRDLGLGVSYGLYAAFGVVAFFVVRGHVTETRGRTLEEISLEHAR